MKKMFFAIAVAACSCGTLLAAAKGSCMSKAIELKSSMNFSLVDEYDPEDGSYSGSGVCYFKVTLKKGTPCSIWISGGSAEEMMFSTFTDWEADYFTTFDEGEAQDGAIKFARLAADDWDEDDPSSVTFYVEVDGDIGQQATISMETRYMEFEPLGSEENKHAIKFLESSVTTTTVDFLDGDYWFSADLAAGRLYRIRTEGGTEESPISLDVTGGESLDFEIIEDAQYADDKNNTAVVIFAKTRGTCFINVASLGDGASFTVKYELLKARSVSAHDSTPLETAGNTATFVPGRRIASWDYADDIIDECLFSISLAKGDRYVFETSGAAVPLLMQVYDSKGATLAQNETMDGVGYNVRTVLEASSAGTYYVGVCNAALNPYEEVTGGAVTLTARPAAAIDGDPDEWDATDDTSDGASGLEVLPGTASSSPQLDGSVHGPHRLSATDWADTFVVAARKGLTYRIGVVFADESDTTKLNLACRLYTRSGSSERVVVNGELSPSGDAFVQFTATANAAYYLRLSVLEGTGLDYPAYNVRAVAYSTSGADLGILTVNTHGAPTATWSIGSESAKYPGGSSVLVSGNQVVKLSAVKGYNASVTTTTVAVNPGIVPTVLDVYYSDTSDPKDDNAAGATAISFKNVDTDYARRTLWDDDPEDNFSFTGTDGCYYDIALRNVEGDSVSFSIFNASTGPIVENVTSVRQLVLPKTKDKYYLTVKNGDFATTYGGYTLSGKFANVGSIKFDKTAVSAKEDAATVSVKVKRTAKDGYVRVKYGTVAGTAKPGEDYVAQNGVLEWTNGDNKDKEVTVKLISDVVPVYEGNKTFSLQLKAFEDDERSEGEYPASIAGGDTCEITLVETSKPGTTAADAYAKKAPKLATVKTEEVPLETGTYYGVLAEDGAVLTNGLPALAAVTFTATTANKLAAKVTVSGKSYSFAGQGWDADQGDGMRRKTLVLSQKLKRFDEGTGKSEDVTLESTLAIAFRAGQTATEGDWLKALCSAELVLNVPDAKNNGCQEEVHYAGELYRNNAKVQGYLNVVTNFTGYYTVALAPEWVSSADGVPAGNGYFTLTIDNKGTAKAAGLLADGTTKLSLSAAACGIVEDASSSSGYAMMVPLYYAKAPAVFGGTLRLFANDDGAVVVDSSNALLWNNDNPALTYYGEEGYRLSLDPVGGWYDTVANLQSYYLTRAFEVSAADVSEFYVEALTANKATQDFDYSFEAQPGGTAVDLSGNAFSTKKRSLAAAGSLYDLASSVNPCNVQVKFARATGLVSGTFSLWSASADGSQQKELSGLKHFGILVMNRDSASPLDSEIASAGFCTQTVKVTDENPETGRKTQRSWTASLPFNILGVDQGEPDWYADDWGE